MPSRYLVEVEYLLPKMAEQITKPEESDVPGVSLRVGHRTWFRSCVSTCWIGEQTFSVPPAPSAGAGGQECLGADLCSDTPQAFLRADGVGGLVGYCQPHPYPCPSCFLPQPEPPGVKFISAGGRGLPAAFFLPLNSNEPGGSGDSRWEAQDRRGPTLLPECDNT